MTITGWPTCAICRKPVDKIDLFYYPEFYGKVFRVSCHGETETAVLSDLDVVQADAIAFRLAFNNPLIVHEQQADRG
jgi:hypothetical protein